MKGLNKVILNREALERDLANNWAVVAEGIQTILRREGYPKPLRGAQALTRTNAHITHESIAAFIETLDVAEAVKEELRALALDLHGHLPVTLTENIPQGRSNTPTRRKARNHVPGPLSLAYVLREDSQLRTATAVRFLHLFKFGLVVFRRAILQGGSRQS